MASKTKGRVRARRAASKPAPRKEPNHTKALREAQRLRAEYSRLVQPDEAHHNLAEAYLDLGRRYAAALETISDLEPPDDGSRNGWFFGDENNG